MLPELGHLLLKRHERPPDLLDLVVGEHALIHSPKGLPFHQLAQQFDDGENEAHQPLLDRLRMQPGFGRIPGWFSGVPDRLVGGVA